VRILDVDPGVLVTVGVTRGRNVPTGLTVRGEWGGVLGLLGRGKARVAAEKKFREAVEKHAKAIEAWKKKAEEAKAKKEEAPERPKAPEPPKPDPDGDALAPVVRGDAPLRVEVHGEAGVRDALEAARRAGVRLVLDGCSGVAAAAGEIPETVPVVIAVAPWGGPPEASPDPADAAALHEAGVPFAIASLGPTGRRSGRLVDLAALAVRAGLPREAALRALTADAARAVGLEDRAGRIAKGLAADVVAWTGDPFASTSRVRWVLVAGRIVHPDREASR
jgi:imidazolonepropionase-like amidohydrolase